ncbi:LytR/AlgR family response regulator transcription factor [Lewinella cohaerens]|uniref:LytR/AlgR family response regulator transcription factor n=1 Tax=Lewinella cohaerens TaxID=70995 RepID=UPI00037DB7C9|nr:LytTR family DNA-binding domain-containing protein [Lewinella cohaerens]
MSKLRAILVEDEPSGMDNLRWKLQNNCPEVEIIAECTSGKEAIRAIKMHLPDLLFLDIRLGDMSGFDVLEAIKHPTFDLIFTTSYDEYAIQAIKNSALDYLLKPIDEDELLDAVGKARQKQRSSSSTGNIPEVPVAPRFGFPISTGQQFIELSEVIYAQAEDNVALVYLKEGKPLKISRSLGWVEEELKDLGFCRIHHSYLINLSAMTEYIRNEGGFVIMEGGKAISISRRRKDDFLKALDRFNLNS